MRIVVTAGGTGGHIHPALVVAEELKQMKHTVLFIGRSGGPEEAKAIDAGFEFVGLDVRGFDRGNFLKLLGALLILPAAVAKAMKILSVFNPQAVIGVGGYASGPACIAAWLKKIPLFLLEQNVYPGLVTRWLSKKAKRVYTSFEESAHWLGGANLLYTGNPTRSGFAPKMFERKTKKTILVMGGSQGAHSINRAMADALPMIKELDLNMFHQTGEADIGEMKEVYATHRPEAVVKAYFDNIADIMRQTDLVIARAGASTCSELSLSGLPALLIPYPGAGGHQKINAQALCSNKAAEMLDDGKLSGETLSKLLTELLADDDRLELMAANSRDMAKPEAAKTISRDITKILEAA